MPSVLITGGTGTIGKRLSALLIEKGYQVTILTRDAAKAARPGAPLSYALWDIDKSEIDVSAVIKADCIIHLAGAGVAEKRWTKKRKQKIIDSRTKSSGLLVKTLRENKTGVKVVISSSATGWYGEDTTASMQNGFREDAPPAGDFLGDTCRVWEESIEPVKDLGIRLVKLRTGIVLSNDGGAYVEFKKPLKAGVAAILGSGKQVVSWVHVEDICRLYLYALENDSLQGAFNAVAPNPVNNKTLIRQIARQLRPRFYLPVYVPAFALKIALGEMSIEVLKSATVSSAKISAAGFGFLYPTIDKAVEALVNEK